MMILYVIKSVILVLYVVKGFGGVGFELENLYNW